MRRQTGFRSLFSSESRLSERRNTSHGVGIERTRHSPAGWQTAPGESLVQQKPLSFPGMSIIRLRRPEKPLTFERAAASGWCSECHRWKWPLAASQCTTTAPAGDSRTAVRRVLQVQRDRQTTVRVVRWSQGIPMFPMLLCAIVQHSTEKTPLKQSGVG